MGEHDLANEEECSEDGHICNHPQDINIEKVVFHQNYSQPKPFQNDIAVIKLEREVEIDDTVSLVCLPYRDQQELYTGDGELGISTAVAGWGATTITGRIPATVLQFLTVNVTDSGQCKEIYAERGGVLGEKQICAGGQKGKVRLDT